MNDSLAAVEMCKKWKLGLNAQLKKSWAATEKSKMFCKMQRKKVSFVSYPSIADEAVAEKSPFLSDEFT